MKLLYILTVTILLFAGCSSANNELQRQYSQDFIKAKYIKLENKIIYDINLKVPNYCYNLAVDTVVKLPKDKKIQVNATIHFKNGLCAQSIKDIKLSNSIKGIKNKYNILELNINDKRTNRIKQYKSLIIY